MPFGQAIIGEAIVNTVVAVSIEIALAHTGGFRVSVDVAQCVERPLLLVVGERRAAIAAFPKMAASFEQAVKAHGRIPVDVMHDTGKLGGVVRLDQIMDMVAHDA